MGECTILAVLENFEIPDNSREKDDGPQSDPAAFAGAQRPRGGDPRGAGLPGQYAGIDENLR